MPIILPRDIPAYSVLDSEQVRVIGADSCTDSHGVKILILNLMPNKSVTETQLFRMLGTSERTVIPTLIRPSAHKSKTTPEDYLRRFYTTWDAVSNDAFDGAIITGAPLERVKYEDVDYWEEFTQISDTLTERGIPTLYLCWAAFASFYRSYSIPTRRLEGKLFGIYEHRVACGCALTRGLPRSFPMPHSRHIGILTEDVERSGLEIDIISEAAGVFAATDAARKRTFFTGHPEYDAWTLRDEYRRDLSRGLPIGVPENYFPGGDVSREPQATWRPAALTLYHNFINSL